MLIAATDPEYILALGTEVTNVKISVEICSSQVANMKWAICIRERGGNEMSFWHSERCKNKAPKIVVSADENNLKQVWFKGSDAVDKPR
jgi:hypothetical protein